MDGRNESKAGKEWKDKGQGNVTIKEGRSMGQVWKKQVKILKE
jgi:hypothetical protein